jgi:hypothetical protein
MQDWSPEQVGQLLVLLPFERRTWDLVDAKGDAVSAWYWAHTPSLYARGEDADEARRAIRTLLAHERPVAAISVIRMALFNKQEIEPSLLMHALEGWMGFAAKVEKPGQLQGSRYDLHLVFQTLQQRAQQEDPGVDVERLAQLEWAFLGLLDGHPAKPVTLHGLLRDDPDSFVQVLGFIFRPKGSSAEDAPEPTQEEKLRAQSGYRLLMSWQEVPGLLGDGTVDGKKLSRWIGRARDQAEERGLLEVCDSRIGEVFAHAPGEPDRTWPCVPVRDAMEDIGTDEIFDGFGVGIYNKRGMVSKSPREGGSQERELAENYRAYAEACRVDWPRTATALRRVADEYEEEARREDAEAMLD